MQIAKQTLFTAVLTALFFIPVVGNAATYSVTKTADTADGTCDADCSLREAVIAANLAGGTNTISVPTGTYRLDGLTTAGENAAATGDLDITSALTITGAGTTATILDGNDTDRVFEVRSGGSLSVNALTVTNGNTSGNGAGISCSSGTLNLTNVLVSYNVATSTGGGIVTSSCSLAVSNTTFDHNTATSDGGAAYISIASGNTITLVDSSFTNNTSARLGGAIEFNQVGGTQVSVLNRVTFSGNSSTGGGTTGGGALEVYARLQITNSTFINNHSDTVGGAIEAPNNGADQLTIAHSTFVQNTAGTHGGGIYVGGSNATVQLKGNILAANTATTSGPDCSASAGLTSSDYNFFGSISGCTFSVQSHDDTTTGARSYMATATLGDNGGSVQTVRMYGPETLDIIPAAACTDAAGSLLTTDARGMSRAQNTNCDRGAYEKDQTNPTVTITTGVDSVECATGTWTNAGATASDNFSTGLTASTSNTVNVNTLGTQTITYTSTADVDSNTGSNTRNVTVQDTTKPVITLIGNASETIAVGDTYTDAGATVSDACDSTVAITTTNPVDTSTAGEYTVSYSAQDATGNVALVQERTVTVADTEPTITTNGKYINVVVNGEVVNRKRINTKRLPSKFYKLASKSLYDGYTSIILVTTSTQKATVNVFRLDSDAMLKKRSVVTFELTERSPIRIKTKRSAKRITVTIGTGEDRVTKLLTLTAKGNLLLPKTE